MFEAVLIAIKEALAALKQPELNAVLSHVPAKGDGFHGPNSLPEEPWNTKDDVKTVAEWIRHHVRLVLEALGKDKRAAAILAAMLPKPSLSPVYRADLSGIPAKARAEFERIEKERYRIDPSHCDKRRKILCRNLKKVLAKGPDTYTSCDDRWPAEVKDAYVEAREKTRKASEKRNQVFSGTPAVCLWALWHVWDKVTLRESIPGCPDWPGVEKMANPFGWQPVTARAAFLACVAGIGPDINAAPGKAANSLKRALDKLHKKLEDRAAKEEAAAGDGGEIITAAVAVQDFHVSASTLRKAVKDRHLKDYRPRAKRGTTSPLKLSRAELSRRYTQQKN